MPYYLDDYDDYNDYDEDFNTKYVTQPKCYRCNEACYWEGRTLYDFDIDEPHICEDKMVATADDFED